MRNKQIQIIYYLYPHRFVNRNSHTISSLGSKIPCFEFYILTRADIIIKGSHTKRTGEKEFKEVFLFFSFSLVLLLLNPL